LCGFVVAWHRLALFGIVLAPLVLSVWRLWCSWRFCTLALSGFALRCCGFGVFGVLGVLAFWRLSASALQRSWHFGIIWRCFGVVWCFGILAPWRFGVLGALALFGVVLASFGALAFWRLGVLVF
jgi:hypothetical protein